MTYYLNFNWNEVCVYTSSFSLRSPSVTPLGRYLFSVSLLLHAYRTFLYRHDAVTSGVNLYKIFVPFAFCQVLKQRPPATRRSLLHQSIVLLLYQSKPNQSINMGNIISAITGALSSFVQVCLLPYISRLCWHQGYRQRLHRYLQGYRSCSQCYRQLYVHPLTLWSKLISVLTCGKCGGGRRGKV